MQNVLKAIFPSVRMTLVVLYKIFNSATRYCEQFDISTRVGLLIGGAHLRTAVMYASFNMSLSFLDWLVGIFANPVSNIAFATHSPELSPVNILPVLLPP